MIYTKGEVVNYVWQYSKFYGEELWQCEELYRNDNGFPALVMLFTIAENIFKSVVENYDDGFYKIIERLHNDGLISEVEYDFLSLGKFSIRKIRNLFAHANLATVNLIFADEPDVLFPLTEETTCLKVYQKISDIMFNIILKVVSNKLIINPDINVVDKISMIGLEIRTLTSTDILELKGFGKEDIDKIDGLDIDENSKIRIANNSSDVKILETILKNLK